MLGVVEVAGAVTGSVVVTKGAGGALPIDAGVAAAVNLGIKDSTLTLHLLTRKGRERQKGCAVHFILITIILKRQVRSAVGTVWLLNR